MIDPYAGWSGAPKQWLVPPQRTESPRTTRATTASRPLPAYRPAPTGRVRGAVAALVTAVVMLLAAGQPASVADLDDCSLAEGC